jgi:hypothetical protein
MLTNQNCIRKQLRGYIDLLGKNKRIVNNETEVLFSASKEIGLEVNDEQASTACEQNVE